MQNLARRTAELPGPERSSGTWRGRFRPLHPGHVCPLERVTIAHSFDYCLGEGSWRFAQREDRWPSFARAVVRSTLFWKSSSASSGSCLVKGRRALVWVWEVRDFCQRAPTAPSKLGAVPSKALLAHKEQHIFLTIGTVFFAQEKRFWSGESKIAVLVRTQLPTTVHTAFLNRLRSVSCSV